MNLLSTLVQFVAFEWTLRPENVPTSQQYFGTLAPLVLQSPGFIRFTYYTHILDSQRGMLVVNFEDPNAIRTWQQHPTHLDIQNKARANVFDHYRIRIGPGGAVNTDSVQEGNDVLDLEEEGKCDKKGVVLLYTRPAKNGTVGIPGLSEDDYGNTFDGFVDVNMYFNEQSQRNIWVTGWKWAGAALEFLKKAERLEGDEVFLYHVERDYSRFRRTDSPTKGNATAKRET